jgi:hypothetical protein
MSTDTDIVRPGNPKRAKLDKLQREITELQPKISGIETAPLAPEDMRASLERGFDRTLTGPSGFEKFDGFLYPASKHHAPEWAHEITWGALAAIFGRDDLIDRVAAHLERNRKGEPGLPLAARAGEVARLRERLEAKERAEELEIVELERQGLVILRRPDCDIELILSIHRGLGGGTAAAQPDPAEPVGVIDAA